VRRGGGEGKSAFEGDAADAKKELVVEGDEGGEAGVDEEDEEEAACLVEE